MKQQTSPFLPFYNLLIECCRYELNNKKLEEYALNIADWDRFLKSAYAHGIYPLVAKSLKNITNVPGKIKSKLKITNLDIAKRNMIMTTELLAVVKLLEDNGISAIAIKGPALSQVIYGDITQRQYSDIDILIDKNEIYKVGLVLESAGYASEHPIEFLKNSTLLKVAKDFCIHDLIHNICIEFHWQLFLERQVRNSKIELFDHSSLVCSINNQIVRILGDDENIIYLLLHGSKHMWERIEWIVDIDRFLRLKRNNINWDRLAALAKNMEIEVMFYLGLSISNELFSTPLNKNIIAKIKTMKKVSIAQTFIYKNMNKNTILNNNTKAIAFTNLYKMQLNRDNNLAIVKHYLSTIFQIKYFDVYMINLPNKLSFLYHFVRIYRIIRFYIFGKR